MLLVVLGILLFVAFLRTANLKAKTGLSLIEACCRGPTCGGFKIPAAAWGIVLQTLGIQLGWAVHGSYVGLENEFIEEHRKLGFATIVLAGALGSIVAIIFFHVLGALSTGEDKAVILFAVKSRPSKNEQPGGMGTAVCDCVRMYGSICCGVGNWKL